MKITMAMKAEETVSWIIKISAEEGDQRGMLSVNSLTTRRLLVTSKTDQDTGRFLEEFCVAIG